MSTPTITAKADHNPKGEVRFATTLCVRFTPELYDLVREGAAQEGRGLAEFMRDAAIIRLAHLGLVPIVTDDPDPGDEET